MSETDIQRDILKALAKIGVRCWRTNSGRKGKVRLAPAGTPDIIGYLEGGKFFGLEVKVPGKALSDDQVKWHGDALMSGCCVGMATSVEEALRVVVRSKMKEAA